MTALYFSLLLAAAENPAPVPTANSTPPVVDLPQAQNMAARANPSFQNGRELISQSDAMIRSAWAMLLPNLNANGSVTRNQRQVAVAFPDFTAPPGPNGELATESVVIQDYWDQSVGLSANMTLFNPRSIPLIQMAYDMADQARLDALLLRNDVLFAVTSAYYQVNSMTEMVKVAKENVALAQEFRRLSELQTQVGQATRIDRLRAEIQAMRAEKELSNARDALQMAYTALGYLIGQKGGFQIVPPEEVPPVREGLGQLTEQALTQRADIQKARFDVSIAEQSKVESWTKWLPVFDVTYAWRWASAEGFSAANDNWMVIFGARWSLFEGGGRIAEMKARAAKARMAENNLAQLQNNIRQDVEQSWQNVQKWRRNVEVDESQVALAEENQRLVTKQYQVGLVSSLDLLNASTELANQRMTRVLDHLQHDIAVLSLQKAVGEYHSLAVASPKD